MKKAKTLTTCTALTVLAAVFAGCAGPGQAAKSTAAAAATAQAQSAVMLSGTVAETMDAGGYTYINLKKDGKNIWVAAPVMKVTVGQELTLLPGGEMPNFYSKALNRSFDNIIFSGGVPDQAAPAPVAAEKPSDSGPIESYEEIMVGKVIETMNAGAYTYLRVEKDGKAAWAAVPRVKVFVGEEVELQPGTPMGEFASKTLGRVFKSIYFASGLAVTSPRAPEAVSSAAPAADAAAEPAAAQLPSGHPKLDAPAAAQLPAGHPPMGGQQAAAQPPAAPAISGKVVETADAGGYTYLLLEKDSQKTWVAVPTMQASVGQEVAVHAGAVMNNFSSKTLNRTFEKIVFSSGPVK